MPRILLFSFTFLFGFLQPNFAQGTLLVNPQEHHIIGTWLLLSTTKSEIFTFKRIWGDPKRHKGLVIEFTNKGTFVYPNSRVIQKCGNYLSSGTLIKNKWTYSNENGILRTTVPIFKGKSKSFKVIKEVVGTLKLEKVNFEGQKRVY